MPGPLKQVLHRVAAQVSYDEGIVYLDKCGSLTRDLHRVLGKSFEFSLPSVQQGELKSGVERIAVVYGPEHATVTQDAVQDVARFVQVAAWMWQAVGTALDVTKKVRRCGIRLTHLFETTDAAHTESVLLESGLVKETPIWAEVFGPQKVRSFTGHLDAPGWVRIRAEISGVGFTLNGPVIEELKPFYPASAISLDLDFVLIEGEQTELRHPDFRESTIRACSAASAFAKKIGERIGT
jgi:hypothetical protein